MTTAGTPKHTSYTKSNQKDVCSLNSRAKRHLSKWEDHVKNNFVRIYESTLPPKLQTQKKNNDDSEQSN